MAGGTRGGAPVPGLLVGGGGPAPGPPRFQPVDVRPEGPGGTPHRRLAPDREAEPLQLFPDPVLLWQAGEFGSP